MTVQRSSIHSARCQGSYNGYMDDLEDAPFQRDYDY